MNDFTRNFKKIIPYLREDTREVVMKHPLYGEKIDITSQNNRVEVYLHRAKRTYAPVLFELHGGGFVLGHAAKDDGLCHMMKEQLDIHVVGINYSKAPECPYPGAIEDVLGVMGYFARNAKFYGMDQNRFAVMGFSAGANLATVASVKSKALEEFNIRCQILHYPFLDAITNPENKAKHPADLPCEVMEAFNELYTTEDNRGLPWVSPILAPDDWLEKSVPALIITAKEDALCEEGIVYGEKLSALGVPVSVKAMAYAHHGYIEDYYNPPCYDVIPEETKKLHNKKFGDAAKEAIQITMEYLKVYLY